MAHQHSQIQSKQQHKYLDWVERIAVAAAIAIILLVLGLALDDSLQMNLLGNTRETPTTSTDAVSHEYLVGEIQQLDVTSPQAQTDSELAPGLADKYIEVLVTQGERKGESIIAGVSAGSSSFISESGEPTLAPGDSVIIVEIGFGDETSYSLYDRHRLPSALLVLVIFFVLAGFFGGKKGFTALLGLVFSMVILVGYIVPQILAGSDPLMISLIGSFGIAGVSLFLAHGINRRTSLSLVSTLIAVGLSVLLATIFVSLTKLFGLGSEESLYLQNLGIVGVNLRGLLLGGIIIGTLGVLDDVTTTQTAAIEEVHLANKKLNFAELYRAGVSIGKEHISSLVNTLVLAYAGSSFALFILLVADNSEPLWVLLNSEFIVEELVRTIVGSVTLMLAVPISSTIAAYYYSKGK